MRQWLRDRGTKLVDDLLLPAVIVLLLLAALWFGGPELVSRLQAAR